MTIHHIVHVEGLNALTDLVQMIYDELNIINTRATCPVTVNPKPAKVVTEPSAAKPMPTLQPSGDNVTIATKTEEPEKTRRNRWTSEEEEIVLYGYANGWSAKAISHYMGLKGYTRSPHAIVDHKSELMKRSK